MKVTILSQAAFWHTLIDNNIIDDLLDKDFFFLSIRNPDDTDKVPFREDSRNFKTMWFYDIEDDIEDENGVKYAKISDDQLLELYTYIMEHSTTKNFIVHCTAGVSRSAAVGSFAFDMFGRQLESYDSFKRRNRNIVPNSYISSKLKELYMTTF